MNNTLSTITTWASIITAISTFFLALYTIKLANATNRMIKENSRTVWKNSVIVAVSDYLGFVDALVHCADLPDFNSRANTEKGQSLRTRIQLLVQDETIVSLLATLLWQIHELIESKWSHMKERQEKYLELRNTTLQQIMKILEEKDKW